MKPRHSEFAIIGAGVVGLATLKALSAQGAEAYCFERAAPGSGQSAGETRVFRHRHGTAPLVGLAAAARRRWQAWEEEFGRRLLGGEGLLRFGPDVEDDAARLYAADVPAAVVDPEFQRAVLPELRLAAGRALFEPMAGALRARRTIEFLASNAQLICEAVLGFERIRGGGFRLFLPDGSWRCERLLLCAGASTPTLAAHDGITIRVDTRCHLRLTFAIRKAWRDRALACLQDGSGVHGELTYGVPVGATGLYAVGLVGSTSDVPVDSAPDSGTLTIADLERRIVRYVQLALPVLTPTPVGARLCQTTKLRGEKDAFSVWQHDRLTAIAGNNLFKFAPALGELLAEAAISDHTPPTFAAIAHAEDGEPTVSWGRT